MKELLKIVFVLLFTVTSAIAGLLASSLIIRSVMQRTLDNMFDAFIYGLLALVAGLIVSIFIVIKAGYEKFKIILIATTIIFLLEIIFLVIANINNWWR